MGTGSKKGDGGEKKPLLLEQDGSNTQNGEYMYSAQHGGSGLSDGRRHRSTTAALEDNAVVIDPASEDSLLAYTAVAQAQRGGGALASKPRCVSRVFIHFFLCGGGGREGGCGDLSHVPYGDARNLEGEGREACRRKYLTKHIVSQDAVQRNAVHNIKLPTGERVISLCKAAVQFNNLYKKHTISH